MMFENVEASGYSYNSTFYQNEFEDILRGIILCYSLMITGKVILTNDENAIRDVLLINYLRNNSIRQKVKLTNYLFDREVQEDRGNGRTDIKIQTTNTFKDTEAYYIIECKRLNNQNVTGDSGLNAEYIKNGICRFVTGYYTSYFGINGMIGFVVETLDIEENNSNINLLLNNDFINDRKEKVTANAVQKLTPQKIVEDFRFSYTTTHQVTEQKQIILYHLLFNFSKNMQ